MPWLVEFTDPRLVAIYETVNAYDPDTQPAFYSSVAREAGASAILDLGCGTGLISRALALEGYRVTGVDPSLAMVEVGRGRSGGDLVRWVVGEASDLDRVVFRAPEAGPFDLAIMSGHVAQFFLEDRAWQDALEALHRVLRPGGTLAFESRNPEARAWEGWTRDARLTVEDPVAGPIEHWSELLEERGGVVAYTNHYRFTATGEERTAPSRLRFRSAAELTATLERGGFAIERLYGDWDRRPFAPGAPEVIVVARR